MCKNAMEKESREEKIDNGETQEKEKVIEAVVFIPYTQDSILKDTLQRAEESITNKLKVPSIRFVERGGKSVSDTLSRNNLCKTEAQCLRSKCPQCWAGGGCCQGGNRSNKEGSWGGRIRSGRNIRREGYVGKQ